MSNPDEEEQGKTAPDPGYGGIEDVDLTPDPNTEDGQASHAKHGRHRAKKAKDVPSKENDALIAEKFMQLYDLLDESQKMEVMSSLDADDDEPSRGSDWAQGLDLDTDFYPGYEKRSRRGEDPDGNDYDGENLHDGDDDESIDLRKAARSGDPRKREQAAKASKRKAARRMEEEEDLEEGVYDLISGSDTEDGEDWSTFDEMDDDAVLADNGDSGAVKLTDSIITYETERYINPKTDRPYSRMRLRNQPPILKFRQHRAGTSEDEDESVDIIITRPLAMQLSALMADIVKAYDGVPLEERKKEPFSFKRLRKSISDTWRYEPAKVIIVVIIVIVFLVFGVYGVIQGL